LFMKDYKVFLRHISDEIEFIMNQSRDLTYELLLEDETLKRAFVRSIEIIGEASKHIPDKVKAHHLDIEWKRIAGTRDVLIHKYFEIDYEILWDIVKNKLPPLRIKMKQILDEE